MRDLKIAYGNSRQAKFWTNKTISFDDLCVRLQTPIRTSETTAEYPKLPKPQRDAIKDKGGFVAGHLRDNRRKVDHVVCRSMVVYDLDAASPEFINDIKSRIPYKGCVYSTHSHTPERPRARVILPAKRDMTPDEHNAVARYVASDLGILEMVDPCSFEPHQLMYWPSCPADGQYLYAELDGDAVDPDGVLAAHPNWTDCSLLPTTPKESTAKKPCDTKQQDPLSKEGAVGFFCRLFPVEEAIDRFLSDVYEPTAIPGRYTYIPGESAAGLVIYESGKFAYSHHATDPAFGKLLNAFDLVRIHKFPDEEPKRSFQAMAGFVMDLPEVRTMAAKERMEKAGEDFAEASDDAWLSRLEYDKKGSLINSLRNIRLIMENDPGLKTIVFNQLADGMEIKGDVPWGHPSKFWRDADDAQLICYVDDRYGTFSQRNYDVAVTKAVDDRAYHPIRDFFESLPEWDGVRRVDTLLTDYLGADDNEYTRAVIRKTLCAAYARVYRPGVKFDYMPVLNGGQGIGKSTFIANLGMEWFSDSLALSDMNDKTAAEKLQGYWLLEIGELAGMKKADIDKVKAFISRQDDKYRASFGRRVTPHPRQCVFFGTTNSENGYLRDITGNRRFWNVKVTGQGDRKPWEMTPEVVRQIWAEVAEIAKSGEKLYLDADLEAYAKKEQREAMEQDDREGLVRDYLEMLLPENWDDMDYYRRKEYIRDVDDPTRAKGVAHRQSVSNIEIWCECFGKSKEEMRPSDSYAISAIMARIEGWEKNGVRQTLPVYGRQRVYLRTT